MAFSSWLRNWKCSLERRWTRFQAPRRKAVARQGVTRPRLELLEERWLLSTSYVVTSTVDTNAPGTLRDAINQVNAGNYNEIDFNIGKVGTTQTINLTSPLPTLTANGVSINGLSQGGSGNTTRLIQLNGSGAASSSDGLLLQGSNCTVSGLILTHFTNGIEVAGDNTTIGGTTTGAGNVLSGNSTDGLLIDSGVSGVQVQGNSIGTTAAGTAALANKVGIEDAGSSNTIGGTVSGARNLISGNSGDGVRIDSGASGNQVLGNAIGVNTYASAALANIGAGIEVGGSNNTLGASYAVAPNQISGNSGAGVLLDSGSNGNLVLGNYIGTNHSGTAALANKVGIEDAGSSNTIGGSILGSRNIISGNSGDGVLIDSSATAETMQDNYIGLNVGGNAALANGSNGVEVKGVSNINGGNSGANSFVRNYISGNSGDGVLLDSGASGNQVLGNFIGIAVSGTQGAGNLANGIEIAGSSNTIGGTISGNKNVISGNGNDGVRIDSTAANNLVAGNDVGTDYTAQKALGNSGNGIEIQGLANTVGGTASGARNIISGNNGDGVRIDSSANSTLVLGNYIGINLSGAALGNGVNGVNIIGINNSVGGTLAAARNIISGNSNDGVLIASGGSGNQVQGNYIGTNVNGTSAAGNLIGIEIAGNSNTVGGSSGARNVISGNSGDGVRIDSGSSSNQVLGNNIGINAYGNAVLGNSGNGIEVAGNNNTLGASYAVAPNVISGNSNDGVLLDSGSSANQVLGSYIGTNPGGTVAMANKVGIEDAGSSNTIGGSILGDKNVISGNSGDGVLIDSTATDETMQGNYIGLSVGGNAALANGSNGVEVQGTGNTIGGNSSLIYFTRNFISGNGNDGVLIDSGASGNQVWGNFIGLDITGTNNLGNLANGVEIAGNSNTIGGIAPSSTNGPASGVCNFISGNSTDGVLIDRTATNNLVQGNYVGTDYTGTTAVGNSGNGIEFMGAGNTLGGTTSAAGNIISGNSSNGVVIDSGASGTLVQGNSIGLNVSGAALGNGGYGVSISSDNNTIGGSVAGAGNSIASNQTGGVLVNAGIGDTISQNSICANGSSNTDPGITLSSGTNNNLAAPTLKFAKLNGDTLKVKGRFKPPTTDVSYVVEFFASPSGDPEGKIYLGSITVMPTHKGKYSFTFTTTTSVTGTNPVITATLTDATGDTSAFSKAVTVK